MAKHIRLQINQGLCKGYNYSFPLHQFPETGVMQQKIKEALFSILASRGYHSWFFDLFSGSGQLSMEALSNGFAPVLANELDKQKLSYIRKNIEQMWKVCPQLETSVFFSSYNAFQILKKPVYILEQLQLSPNCSTGVIFCDPPFITDAKGNIVRNFWDRFFDAIQVFLKNELRPNADLFLHIPAALDHSYTSDANFLREYGNHKIAGFLQTESGVDYLSKK